MALRFMLWWGLAAGWCVVAATVLNQDSIAAFADSVLALVAAVGAARRQRRRLRGPRHARLAPPGMALLLGLPLRPGMAAHVAVWLYMSASVAPLGPFWPGLPPLESLDNGLDRRLTATFTTEDARPAGPIMIRVSPSGVKLPVFASFTVFRLTCVARDGQGEARPAQGHRSPRLDRLSEFVDSSSRLEQSRPVRAGARPQYARALVRCDDQLPIRS